MKFFGYMSLGGGPELDFGIGHTHEGQPVGPHRGRWRMATDLKDTTLSIPSRDKQLQVFYSRGIEHLAPRLAQLDSEDGPNYKAKLQSVLNGTYELQSVVGAVNTISTSSHHTLTLFSNDMDWPLHIIGLFDVQHKTTYLFWSTNPSLIMSVLDVHPLRFLIYRFPTAGLVFLRTEVLCSQWRSWMRKSEFSALLPFNALERRLFN